MAHDRNGVMAPSMIHCIRNRVFYGWHGLSYLLLFETGNDYFKVGEYHGKWKTFRLFRVGLEADFQVRPYWRFLINCQPNDWMIGWAFDGQIYIIWDEWNIGQALLGQGWKVMDIIGKHWGNSRLIYLHYLYTVVDIFVYDKYIE